MFVLPDAVGPNRITTGMVLELLGFNPEFDFLGKNLSCRQGNYFTIAVFDFRIF